MRRFRLFQATKLGSEDALDGTEYGHESQVFHNIEEGVLVCGTNKQNHAWANFMFAVINAQPSTTFDHYVNLILKVRSLHVFCPGR